MMKQIINWFVENDPDDSTITLISHNNNLIFLKYAGTYYFFV